MSFPPECYTKVGPYLFLTRFTNNQTGYLGKNRNDREDIEV